MSVASDGSVVCPVCEHAVDPHHSYRCKHCGKNLLDYEKRRRR